ncbi:tRNA (adenine-N(1)-)-methyltransferase catalytic subunit trm61 [Gryganskiella cystojenkinii]|nr:tRNA (adenine-N(1)-)-methyltransferase catalytic subunit trm61 [Gryganskiella cystojenkinii]
MTSAQVAKTPNFASYKASNTIEEGDQVVLYMSKENVILVRIDAKETFNCRFGSYRHEDMIGLQYGTKLGSNTGRGFVYLLYPTPELWTLILPHRTQILYIADISFVMSFLDLKPGKSMIESGTGSGSFSHSIARTIAPTGHLYTFEYHQERVNAATKEFEDHGLSDMITLQCRDVCKNGFDLEDKVEAVFLDLPAPWEAVASAKRAFKKNKMGKICTFSPCIEQISKTVTALSEHKFVDIQMYECLIRFQEVRVLPVITIEEAMERERIHESKRQRAMPRVLRDSYKESLTRNSVDDEEDSDLPPAKHVKVDDETITETATTTSTDSIQTASASSSLPGTPAQESGEGRAVTTTKLPVEQRGHTSYLLFATLPPSIVKA